MEGIHTMNMQDPKYHNVNQPLEHVRRVVPDAEMTDSQLESREKMLYSMRERAWESYSVLDGALHSVRMERTRRQEAKREQ
jgi:hypothetical protein